MDLLVGLLAAGAALAAAWFAYRSLAAQSRLEASEFRRAAADVLHVLTTGEVAEARNVLGTLRYGDEATVERLARPDVSRAYYSVSWAIERASLGFAQVGEAGSARSEIVHDLRESLRWHVTELVTNLALDRRAAPAIDDADAWEELCRHAIRLDVPARAILDGLSEEGVRAVERRHELVAGV